MYGMISVALILLEVFPGEKSFQTSPGLDSAYRMEELLELTCGLAIRVSGYRLRTPDNVNGFRSRSVGKETGWKNRVVMKQTLRGDLSVEAKKLDVGNTPELSSRKSGNERLTL